MPISLKFVAQCLVDNKSVLGQVIACFEQAKAIMIILTNVDQVLWHSPYGVTRLQYNHDKNILKLTKSYWMGYEQSITLWILIYWYLEIINS